MELNLLLSFFRTESGTRGCRTGATTGSNPVTLCSATSRRAPSASRSVADCWDQLEASPSPSSASSSQSFPKLFFSLLFRLWISFQYLSLVSPLLLSFAPLLLMLPPSGDDIAKLFWPQITILSEICCVIRQLPRDSIQFLNYIWVLFTSP